MNKSNKSKRSFRLLFPSYLPKRMSNSNYEQKKNEKKALRTRLKKAPTVLYTQKPTNGRKHKQTHWVIICSEVTQNFLEWDKVRDNSGIELRVQFVFQMVVLSTSYLILLSWCHLLAFRNLFVKVTDFFALPWAIQEISELLFIIFASCLASLYWGQHDQVTVRSREYF